MSEAEGYGNGKMELSESKVGGDGTRRGGERGRV